MKGREDGVIRCIGCLQGCSGENGKGEFTSLIIWQKHMLDKLGVEVLLNTKANRGVISNGKNKTTYHSKCISRTLSG